MLLFTGNTINARPLVCWTCGASSFPLRAQAKCDVCPAGHHGLLARAISKEAGCRKCPAGSAATLAKFSNLAAHAFAPGCKPCPPGTLSERSGRRMDTAHMQNDDSEANTRTITRPLASEKICVGTCTVQIALQAFACQHAGIWETSWRVGWRGTRASVPYPRQSMSRCAATLSCTNLWNWYAARST